MKKIKTMIAELVLKGCKKDFGIGVGVVESREIEFTDRCNRGFDSPLFTAAMMEAEDQLIKDNVIVRWTEKKRATRRAKK